MRFALLGTHSDGIAMARALTATGRHELVACTHPAKWAPEARRVTDIEELLADPAAEAVIVATRPANRPAALRRALQSERHVLCVHPADETPDLAYEAAMIQGDTGHVLLPLLTEALHPGVVRLSELLRDAQGPLGVLRLIAVEHRSSGEIFYNVEEPSNRPSIPGWDVLRALGGEIAEVTAFAAREEVEPGEPLMVAGRFERGGTFHVSLVPRDPGVSSRYEVIGTRGRAMLQFLPEDAGPSLLTWQRPEGQGGEESWDRWEPWPTFVQLFEAAVEETKDKGERTQDKRLSWQDEVRALELDDAARRSVQRRRVTALEYPEASEEVGFKGTMTLVGCGLLWVVLLLVILSYWVPQLGWLVIPLLGGFLLLQTLRWVIASGNRRPSEPRTSGREGN